MVKDHKTYEDRITQRRRKNRPMNFTAKMRFSYACTNKTIHMQSEKFVCDSYSQQNLECSDFR